MIKIISISTDLGANQSTVAFKLFDTSTPLHRMIDEFETVVDGRYDTLDDHELIHKLEDLLVSGAANANPAA